MVVEINQSVNRPINKLINRSAAGWLSACNRQINAYWHMAADVRGVVKGVMEANSNSKLSPLISCFLTSPTNPFFIPLLQNLASPLINMRICIRFYRRSESNLTRVALKKKHAKNVSCIDNRFLSHTLSDLAHWPLFVSSLMSISMETKNLCAKTRLPHDVFSRPTQGMKTR